MAETVTGVMKGMAARTPKVIWLCWFQGLDAAPSVVRACHESWVKGNPGWRVTVLDGVTIGRHASLDYASGSYAALPPQQRADLLRLDVLARYGGVWADATSWCAKPLDTWLPQVSGSGFFAFARPGPDRLLSNWFLAAEPGNVLITRLLERMAAYWDQAWRPRGAGLGKLLNRGPRTRALWFCWPVARGLRVMPYFAFHYGFERLIRDDGAAAAVWARTPQVSADGPHMLLHAGLSSPVTPQIRAAISIPGAPLWKLSWKDGGIMPGSVLDCLLGSAHASTADGVGGQHSASYPPPWRPQDPASDQIAVEPVERVADTGAVPGEQATRSWDTAEPGGVH